MSTPRTCWRSSGRSVSRGVVRRWCGSRTVRRGCRRARSSVDWPRSDGFSSIWSSAVSSCNPVPHGLSTRSPNRTVPLIRTPRTLPRVIDPDQADALLGALRTHRDRAMVLAMLLGGLRRCEVLALRLSDVHPGEKRLFIGDGKGGHQRIVPVSPRFFTTLADYLELERPETAPTDQVFVVFKGQRRGRPLSAAGLDEIIAGPRRRAGIEHLTCHQLRHTCFTRLREAGMALEAIQAQAGHRSIESTRIYLHLANDWLAGEYRRAVEAIDAQAVAGS